MTVVGHIGPPSPSASRPDLEPVPGFEALGVVAFTTTRARGSFALQSRESAADIFGRWSALANELRPLATRLATAHQVHGAGVVVHDGTWQGWLREPEGDAHVALRAGTALAVSVADCVPVFVAHPGGAVAIAHSGWRGTVTNVAVRTIERLAGAGLAPHDLVVHLGPAICGACYEVSPDVHARLTGRAVPRPTPVDLRAIIAEAVRGAGVSQVTVSPWCTRCHNDRFFSHRCGDEGRQLGVIVRA